MNKKLVLLGFGFFLLGVVGVIGFSLFAGDKKAPNTSGTKFSSCVVLDEEFCNQGEDVFYQGDFFGLGFNVPAGTRIYGPFEGEFVVNPITLGVQGDPSYETVRVYSFPGDKRSADENSLGFWALGLIEPIPWKEKVEKGEVLAKAVEGEEIKGVGNYNLVLTFLRFSPQTRLYERDLSLFEEYFQL